MCLTCGCGTTHTHTHEHDHEHDHAHDHAHEHSHGHPHTHAKSDGRRLSLEQDILGENNRYAAANRARWQALGVFALNLVSSPGSGKTSVLVRTIEALRDQMPLAVIEGDQQTANDAQRILAAGAPAIQINTGKGCHLEAHGVGHAAEALPLSAGALLLIENVGNLVCPAAFDLGEAHKVAVLSVTEGEDKPIKYPDMFAAADVLLLNKIDLLPYVDFDVARALAYARQVNPGIRVFQLSARSGEGMAHWLGWLREGCQQARQALPQPPHGVAAVHA
ncbi:MAG: hydrogenase nickel incorporation protein HypB [Burkholderiaceae bacterium]|jgi:hydrogenase nickel incorporation protein HypB|nr:hydrogenase nickel incorporation protein HypB [Burkholderiaceae bacterium]